MDTNEVKLRLLEMEWTWDDIDDESKKAMEQLEQVIDKYINFIEVLGEIEDAD